MLTYLFTATFKDKTQIKQDQKDESTRGGRNTYSDVLETITEGNQLVLFTLDQQKLWNPTKAVVNLLTGVITVNGVALYPEVLPKTALTLYWMMTVVQTMQVKHKGLDFMSKQVMPERRTYFLGWEVDGVRHVIGVL